jgi:hypothetical protein
VTKGIATGPRFALGGARPTALCAVSAVGRYLAFRGHAATSARRGADPWWCIDLCRRSGWFGPPDGTFLAPAFGFAWDGIPPHLMLERQRLESCKRSADFL